MCAGGVPVQVLVVKDAGVFVQGDDVRVRQSGLALTGGAAIGLVQPELRSALAQNALCRGVPGRGDAVRLLDAGHLVGRLYGAMEVQMGQQCGIVDAPEPHARLRGLADGGQPRNITQFPQRFDRCGDTSNLELTGPESPGLGYRQVPEILRPQADKLRATARNDFQRGTRIRLRYPSLEIGFGHIGNLDIVPEAVLHRAGEYDASLDTACAAGFRQASAPILDMTRMEPGPVAVRAIRTVCMIWIIRTVGAV